MTGGPLRNLHRSGKFIRHPEGEVSMNMRTLLAMALVAGTAVACSHSDNPRIATYPSAASYYGPSAGSYAPDFGNWTTAKKPPALSADAGANRRDCAQIGRA